MRSHASLRAVLAFAATCLSLNALAEAGRFQFVIGDVQVKPAKGEARAARKGEAVDEGDLVITGRAAQAQLAMADQGIIAIRPETELRIDTYRYAGRNDDSGRSLLNLLRGGFRSLTGLIGKNNYQVRTPNATIGIRGTDHEPFVIPEPPPGVTPPGPPGTYDKVNAGETYIETSGGRLDLAANQVGFAPPLSTAKPVLLPEVPAFLRAVAAAKNVDERRSAKSDERERREPRQRQEAPAVPATPVVPPPRGSLDPRNAVALVPVPAGTVFTGGDLSVLTDGRKDLGAGVAIVGQGFIATVDTAGHPAVVASDEFTFRRNDAPLLQDDATTLGGSPVKWGIYAGGRIDDRAGSRSPSLFHYMLAPNATPLVVLRDIHGPLHFTATATSTEYTKPITEDGRVGGIVGLAVAIENLAGTPLLTGYSLRVTDAANRNWSADLAAPVSIANFSAGPTQEPGSAGAPLFVQCAGPTCNQPKGFGVAHGAVIGTPPLGVVSSYRLGAGSSGVTGSVLAR